MVKIGALSNRHKAICLIIAFIEILINATAFAAEENSLSRSAYLATRKNKRLTGHVVKRFESPSLMSCSQSCLKNSWCTSTNFCKKSLKKDDKGTCELNKHEIAPINEDTKFVDQPGVTFSLFRKGCHITGCLNGGSCLFDTKTETFACSCRLAWSGDKCEIPQTSCQDVKANESAQAVSGKYWLNSQGSTFPVYCHMETTAKVWTLIARFSNKDSKNWMEDSGDWWYDKNVTAGETTDPSSNTDMISPAFWLVSGNEFKITRSDDRQHTALLQTTGDCLGGHTFRSKITSYGDFRNGSTWEVGQCLGNCTVQYGGQYNTTKGFAAAKCDGPIQSADKIGFWCEHQRSGSVMTVGGAGGNGSCDHTYHGIAITAAFVASFVELDRSEYDFGDYAFFGGTTSAYSLNLWIR